MDEIKKDLPPETVLPPEQQEGRRDYSKELLELLEQNLPDEELKEKLSDYHESDIAEILPEITKDERLRLYKILGNEAVSEIFTYLDNVEDFISELDNEKAADIIEEMDADDAIEVLDELEEDKRSEIFDLLDEDAAKDIELIEKYDDDQIGSRMTTNFVTVSITMSVKQAMKSVVDQAAENDNISTVYVTDENGVYAGAFSLRDLVVARAGTPLEDITVSAYPYFFADEKVSQCIEELKDYSEDSLPVLNRDNKVIGAITSSELVDVVDSELGDDYAKLAGLTQEEDLEEPVTKSAAKRLPWLLLLMGLGLVVSSLISSFQEIQSKLPILIAFQSLILDMSGNGGTQSLAVTIRVISSSNLDAKQVWRLILKEMRVGLLNGLVLGLSSTIICTAFIMLFQKYAFVKALAYGGCIGASLLIAIFLSALGGTLIPLFFKKIKIDPAVASGPLITTVNDLVSATIYYTLANVFLIGMMNLGV